MKKQINFLDFLRSLVFFPTCSFLYLYFASSFYDLIGEADRLSNLVLSFILIDCGAVFLSLLLSLFIVRNKLKVISGTVFMWMLFMTIIILDVSRNLYAPEVFVDSLVRLSFSAIGIMLAIVLWTQILSMFFSEEEVNMPRISKKRKPKRYRSSFIINMHALISVPMTYFSLVVYIITPICVALWLLLAVMQLENVPYVIWVLLGCIQVFALIVSYILVRIILFPLPQLCPALKLDIESSPVLKATIQDACDKVKVKFPDVIIINAEPTIFVREGKLRIFEGIINGRILALGLPLLKELTMDELKVLIMHEMIYFSGMDKHYSLKVMPLYKLLDANIHNEDILKKRQIAEYKTAGLHTFLMLIPRLFLQIFYDYFAMIDELIWWGRKSRADWKAAKYYGKEVFGSALTRMRQISEYFSTVSYRFPFSEENFFMRFSQMIKNNPEEFEEHKQFLMRNKQDPTRYSVLKFRIENLPETKKTETSADFMEDIRMEIYNIELRLSLIYQHFRHISRYYTELTRLLQEYKGVVPELELSERVFSLFKGKKDAEDKVT